MARSRFVGVSGESTSRRAGHSSRKLPTLLPSRSNARRPITRVDAELPDIHSALQPSASIALAS